MCYLYKCSKRLISGLIIMTKFVLFLNLVFVTPSFAAWELLSKLPQPLESSGAKHSCITGFIWAKEQFVVTGSWDSSDAFNVWCEDMENGYVLTSTDGINWTQQTSGLQNNNQGITSMAYSGSRFIIAGNKGKSYTSTDGINWSTLKFSSPNYFGPDVVWSGKEFINNYWRSADGINWTNMTSSFTPIKAASNNLILALDNGRRELQMSTDGFFWSESFAVVRSGGAPEHKLRGVVWSGTEFMVVGDDDIVSSADGTNWVYEMRESNLPLSIPGYGNNFTGIYWTGEYYIVSGWSTYTKVLGKAWARQDVAVKGQFTSNGVDLFQIDANKEVYVHVGSFPLADAGPDITVSAKDVVMLEGSGSDDDHAISSYLWEVDDRIRADELVTLDDPMTASTSFVAPCVPITTRIIARLIVTDEQGEKGADERIITVMPTSDICPEYPTVSIAADATPTIDSSFPHILNYKLTGSVSAPIENITSYRWEQRDGLQEGSFTSESNSTTTFSISDRVGKSTITLRLYATNESGITGYDDIQINVDPVALSVEEPSVSLGLSVKALGGTVIPLNGVINDPNNVVDSYLWEQTSGSKQGVFSSTDTVNSIFTLPSFEDDETIVLKLSAISNSEVIASDQIGISVISPFESDNSPSVNLGSDKSVRAGEKISLTASVYDPAGSIASYYWEEIGMPSGTFSTRTAILTQFSPVLVREEKIITLRFTATDQNGATIFDDINLTIIPSEIPNIAPTVSVGDDITSQSGTMIVLNGSFSDSDGLVEKFHWEQLSGSVDLALSNTDQERVEITLPNVTEATEVTLRLTVTDNEDETASDEIILIIEPQQESKDDRNGGSAIFDVLLMLSFMLAIFLRRHSSNW